MTAQTKVVAVEAMAATGPSFAAALCGFLSTTVATTMLMFLLSSV
ncbi:hypothetical protein [Methylobacterium nigriterrae]